LDGGGRLHQPGATELDLHGGAMAKRGGSLEWGLACAMVYGFQRFQTQIKAEVEGFSPRGIPGGDSHWKVVCNGKDSTLVLGNGGRELHGAESTGSSPNRCGTASGSQCGAKHRREVALCVGAAARV
jgi:hypothetical protein